MYYRVGCIFFVMDFRVECTRMCVQLSVPPQVGGGFGAKRKSRKKSGAETKTTTFDDADNARSPAGALVGERRLWSKPDTLLRRSSASLCSVQSACMVFWTHEGAFQKRSDTLRRVVDTFGRYFSENFSELLARRPTCQSCRIPRSERGSGRGSACSEC